MRNWGDNTHNAATKAATQDGRGQSHKSNTIDAHNSAASKITNRPAPGTAASATPSSHAMTGGCQVL